VNDDQPISGAEAAAVIAGLVPAVARVSLHPQWTDTTAATRRRQQQVTLYDAAGAVVGDLDAHRAACRVLMAAFPGAEWGRPQTFDVAAGTLRLTYPMPAWQVRDDCTCADTAGGAE
jgi:hypothetical protein